MGLRDVLEIMKDMGVRIEQVRGSGGGARSPLWRQILADVFDKEVVTVTATEGAAFGAAMLAGGGSGVFPSVEAACDRTIALVHATAPAPAGAAAYGRLCDAFRGLSPSP